VKRCHNCGNVVMAIVMFCDACGLFLGELKSIHPHQETYYPQNYQFGSSIIGATTSTTAAPGFYKLG